MKKIIVYTCGDSTDVTTWSNVPYLFTSILEKKGYKLYRVDISPSKKINKLFNSISYKIFRRFFHLEACPEFHRTWLHRFIVKRRLKCAAKKYSDADLNLFLSFAFYNKYSNKPNVLWCDWTDFIVIERLGRAVKWYEKSSIKHENNVLKNADLVYTMFPKVKEHMENLYQRKIKYLNRNVVNTVYDKGFDIEDIVSRRNRSNKILFIGNLRYKSGAELLIKAFGTLHNVDNNLELHIIGMNENEIGKFDGVFCHGYLRKNVEEEKQIYYDLLLSSRVLVNPTAGWAGYSSCIEAMFYGCPIIVSPFDDFVEEFGENIKFGYYCNNDNLQENLEKIFNEEHYIDLCYSAYNSVKDYTWSNYVDEFISSLKEEKIL